ncbi:CHAT domain-containing protein [Nostoc favosum]|uniref:CHAT domain-containing protein n=1 Tax=Nostoc favosum CHAB5714 TaxID=2780399 RepID=A0ABS8IJ30_9NOSO|nr:CHAT domain-containing protein [Nostoc favosum]MCC5603810.1 CHAT domain-containing protein [Nostoc favosum CHAB5714]
MFTDAKENKRAYNEMNLLGTLSDFYRGLGDYQKSIDYSQQAVSTAHKLQHPQIEAASLFSIALSYFNKGEPEKTIEYAERGIAISKNYRMLGTQFFGNAVRSLGYGELGNDQIATEAAKTNLELAKKTKNPYFQKIALQTLGLVHNKFGRKQEAIQAYLGALSVKIPASQLGQNAGIYAGLARTYADLNQPTTAIAYYKKSIDEFEQIRRGVKGLSQQYQNSFLNVTIDFERRKVSDVYRELVDLLLSQGREKEALVVRDLLGTQEIREFVADRGARGEEVKIPQTDFEKKIEAGGESIIALGRQISECDRANCPQKTELNDKLQTLTEDFTKQLQLIEQEIRENRQKDDAFFDPRNKAKIREIVESKPGTVMIYPLVVENRLWLLMYSEGDVVKKQEISVKREELGKTVLEFRQLMEKCEKLVYCGGEEISKVQAVSKKLYNWLIKPLEPELKANPVKNIVFALDRVTRYVPMSALFDGKQYLIEKYTVYNVLSADLTDMDKKLPTGIENTPVLAMGLSNSGNIQGLSFKSLRNVPKELNAIVRNKTNKQGIYPGLEYLNNAFDFTTLRDNLRGHKILHLATHGKFVPDKKDESFLVSGNYEPIELYKINSLRGLSGIHLVVLSACQTALAGPYQDGVEINSLAYYFMNNGAKAVISSLWQVADESTSLLMQRFYSNLAKDGGQNASPRTAEALRQAQLSLLRGKNFKTENSEQRAFEGRIKPGTASRNEKPISGYSHPYYWAPFILIGNGL